MGTVETSLAVAVDLRDGVAGGRPTGSPSVSLADRPETFTRTPSGYHVLSDLPADVGEVTVVVDDCDAHLTERRTVDLDGDRSTPETVELLPSPAYPFGSGATVVRGFVSDESGAPIAGATVTIQERDERTRTNTAGEYAVGIRSIESDDVSDDNALEVDGETPVLEATHPETGATTAAETVIDVGKTARQDVEF